MRHPWLTLLSLASLGAIVLIFFWFRVQPIRLPEQDIEQTTQTLVVPTVTFVNPSKGPEAATVTIVEFADFACSACREVSAILQMVQSAFPEDVRVVFKHLPNDSLHPTATLASLASMCAESQQAFWQYHDVLFAQQALLSESQLLQIAEELRLNSESFSECLASENPKPLIQKDMEEAEALGIVATPTIFIGEKRWVGAFDPSELIEYVKSQIGQ